MRAHASTRYLSRVLEVISAIDNRGTVLIVLHFEHLTGGQAIQSECISDSQQGIKSKAKEEYCEAVI